jgi:glutamate-1-semialdehyde aminotransferase
MARTATVPPHTAAQRFDALARPYVERTARSRLASASHRATLADVRVGNRFEPGWKELVYPIVCDESAGARLYDVDGNEYIDLTMGFGVHLFGHSPPFVEAAILAQLRTGWHLGAENSLSGAVAEALAAATGMERVAFVNTGSEAVMTALRLARSATGRSRVAMFSGSYHGWFDGVLARPGEAPDGAALASGPGIPSSAVADVTVLPYGEPASAQAIREADEPFAAILVEPVQVRRPGVKPRAWLAELREAADATGAALVFDEMVTGFRVSPGGAQQLLGVRADMATYGKVLGGGMPIGAVAGDAAFLDAIDGGRWSYGDDSEPGTTKTVFAGTFSRHPLAMAAAQAVMSHLEQHGADLYAGLEERTAGLVAEVEALLAAAGAPFGVERCASMFRLDIEDRPLRELLSYQLVHRGVFVCETNTWFLSTAHGDRDCELVVEALAGALRELAGAWR